jgi:hypothetical protein
MACALPRRRCPTTTPDGGPIAKQWSRLAYASGWPHLDLLHHHCEDGLLAADDSSAFMTFLILFLDAQNVTAISFD